MNRDEAKEVIKSRYAELLQPAKVKGTYVCPKPTCKNGTGEDGDGIRLDPNRPGKYKLHCYKCGFDGDVIALFQEAFGYDFKTAVDELGGKLGIIVDAHEPRRADIKPARASRAVETHAEPQEDVTPDFSAYIADCCSHLGDPQAQSYLSSRGISDYTARRFALGYDPLRNIIVMPVSSGYYTTRSVDPNATGFKRFKNNPKGAKVELFNSEALYDDDKRPVIIVESSIDALSIIEAGGVAVGLNGAGNVKLLLRTLEEQPTVKSIVIALDNDDTGERFAGELSHGLEKLEARYYKRNIYGEHHDANDALRANRQQLAASIAEAERAAGKPDNMADYILGGMFDEAKKLQEQRYRKTGFRNLDEQAGAIYSGLYTIGGISSVGKTSFITQLADQMAAQGQHVIFFSMEQSRLEIASKSISRLTAIDDARKGKTALQIRLGDYDGFSNVEQQIANYLNTIGERVSVVEGNFSTTVGRIRRYTADYMEANGVKPVVIVDYLQVLQADVDPATGRRISDKRLAVDYNVTELKRMSRELDIPVFVVSSFNRGNYLTPIDFESFKESGGIEYTSDCVWGLQLAAIHDDLFKGDEKKEIAKKRERMAQAKDEIPRKIELVCLKNRFGRSRYSCNFRYYPQFDLFEPAES